MKKIGLVIIMIVLLATVANAASINGDYKGNPIIKLTVDGVPVKVTDTPAVIMDGRTMIPIYLLKEANINYSWDQKTQKVDIKKGKDIFSDINSLIIANQYNDFFQKLEACNNRAESFANSLINSNPNSSEEMTICEGELISLLTSNDNNLTSPNVYTTNTSELKKLSSEANILLKKYSDQVDKLLVSDYVGAEKFYVDIYNDGEKLILSTSDYVYNLMIYIQKGTTPTTTPTPIPEPVIEEVAPEKEYVPIIIPSTTSVIKSKIENDFDGFEYGNIYELTNGQYWKQTDYTYKYSYKYRPDVLIYKDGLYFYMNVEGVDKDPRVELIN